jgi:hypothetical protein
MNDHYIIVCYLIFKVPVFLLVYNDYKELGGLDLDTMFDVFWCKFVICFKLSMFPIDPWLVNYLKIQVD